MSICWYIGTKYTSVCVEVLSTLAVLCVGYTLGRVVAFVKERSRLRRENRRLRAWIGLDRCGDCKACDEGEELDKNCPFAGEPDGCNNRNCREYVLWHGKE